MGIDDITTPRKGFPVNPTSVREEERQWEDGDFDTWTISHCLHSPRRFSTTSEGSSQKYALMYLSSKAIYIDKLHFCGWSTEPEIGLLFPLLPEALGVSLEKQWGFVCLTWASPSQAEERPLFHTAGMEESSVHHEMDRSHHTESSWNQWKQIDTGQIQAALKLIIWFIRKQTLQFRNYQQQSSLLGLLLPQMSQIKDHLKGCDSFQYKATSFALIAGECDLNETSWLCPEEDYSVSHDP